MGNFSNWQILILALALPVLALATLWTVRSSKRRADVKKQSCAQALLPLVKRYTDLVQELSRDLRFAFDHADQLTPENEEAAENLINAVENTEQAIRQQTRLLARLHEKKLAADIEAFLLNERNIRHASPRDLERFLETGLDRSAALAAQLQALAG